MPSRPAFDDRDPQQREDDAAAELVQRSVVDTPCRGRVLDRDRVVRGPADRDRARTAVVRRWNDRDRTTGVRDAAPLISRLALSKVLPQKTAAEEHLRATVPGYTIIRPGGLPPGVVPTGRGILSEDVSTMGFIKRPDLARLVVGVLYDDRTIGKTLAAVDPGLGRPWEGGDPE